MRVVGIDQSYTSSGIVLLEKGEFLEGHKFVANKEKNRFAQAHEIALHIAEIVEDFKPDMIAIEGLAFGMRGNVTRDLGGLQFVIIAHLQEVLKYDVEIIAPTSAKKFATGSGRADKQSMIDSLPKHVYNYCANLGMKKTTGLSDMADAYWIAKTAENNIKGK